jgi:uncharacterized damage-inducible protein DinB
MITPTYARTLARYNRWMNEKLYECAAQLDDAARKENVGAFFKSIHGTLNHLLLADRIWMGRFTGVPFAATSLAQELYADFDELRRERALTDAAIEAYMGALTAEQLAGTLTYRTMSNPQTRSQALALPLTHFFNHQTHHRGQVTTLLSQRGIDPGVTDLLWLLME